MTFSFLGQGKDGVVVFPPIECEVDIEPTNFVGKIYYTKGKNSPSSVKSKIDALPDELDGLLYYKENYLCEVVLPRDIPAFNRLSNKQLILKRVEGETLVDALHNYIVNNNGCGFFEVFKSAIETYYMIGNLAEKNVYYSDYSASNIIYDSKNKRLMLIDLDDISYDKPRGIPKSIVYNHKTKTYNPNYHIEGNLAYITWYNDFIKQIIRPILSAMFDGLSGKADDWLIDENTNSGFLERKIAFEKFIGKPYEELSHTDIDFINDNLETLRDEFCKTIGGSKKHKSRKNKTKKNKRRKIKQTKNKTKKK